ncbi:MAG: hypothetical protein Q7V61_03285 [Actinomycetota bacterium]|nr:hypothetical protein [Actinomycetota bacterium]
MASYYVNDRAQANGDHEVHKDGCMFMPSAGNKRYLGEFTDCAPAVTKAKTIYPGSTNGCATCCPACHTS